MKKLLARLFPRLSLIFPAIFSGLLLSLCFPPASLWILSFIALVPLLVGVARVRPSRKDCYKAGFLCGVCFFFVLLWWIVKLIPSADITVPWLMTPALILMVLYLSLYPAVFLLLLSVITRFRFWGMILAVPPLWVLLELARSMGELAFPCGVMGYALSDTPSMVQSASFWGVEGLSFVIVAVNVMVAGVFIAKTTRAKIFCGCAAVLIVAGVWFAGKSMIEKYEIDSSKTIKVAVVQPNVDLAVKWKPEFRDSTFDLIEKYAREAAGLGAELIVFPETSAPVYIDGKDPKYKQRLLTLAQNLGVPIYIGFLDHRFDGPEGALNIFNSSGLFDPRGGLDKYDKNHLLPFSEQLPLSTHFRWLRKIPFGQANFQPGPKRRPLSVDGGTFTPLICFESVLGYLCRRGVKDGANLFVNITNDGWFGNTPGPVQHAQMCLLRTVECRRYLIRCANSGVSMIVDPAGRVITGLGLYQQGIFALDVALLEGVTFYSRYGDLPLVLLSLLVVIVAAAVVRFAR
jgi:apolipoprotein N-acyltransferase